MKAYQYNSTDNFYHRPNDGEFGYKDSGDAQNRIYNIIRGAKDRGMFSSEVMNQASDWPTFYHLTPMRANILRPFAKEIAAGHTLELGAGCGAVTRFIGELGGTVVAVEGSPDRARIIGNRCAELKNVTVIADLIQNFQPEEKFDVVTLIGVLEYAQVYVNEPNPIQYLLKVAKSFLKDNGLLIIAIENQLGLKYFCGSAEDHLGRPMIGVNDSYTDKSPITFGREELTSYIEEVGFKSVDLYVPLPDYKTPVSIIYPKGFEDESRAAGWDVSPILAGSTVHDRQRPMHPTFSLECAWGVIGRNKLAQDLANSFLFAARVAPPKQTENVLAAHYGSQRPAQFAKETQFVLDKNKLMTQTRSVANTANLSKASWDIGPYRTGRLWFDELLQIINRPNWQFADLSTWAGVWIEGLKTVTPAPKNSAITELHHFKTLLPAKYIDATPTNFIVSKEGKGDFFDLEWNFSTALPIDFIVFRGLFLTLHRVTSCARPASNVPVKLYDLTMAIMEQHGMINGTDDLDLFLAIFNAFQNQTQDLPPDVMNGLTAELDTAMLPIRQLFT
ncbi:MAG: class I SAM-dependent methyltransferase [Methylotenera sp.]|nr:class I SAM-dependent methyltransferase [Methylotenera sp.]